MKFPGEHGGSGQQSYCYLFIGDVNHIYYMSHGHISHVSHMIFIARGA